MKLTIRQRLARDFALQIYEEKARDIRACTVVSKRDWDTIQAESSPEAVSKLALERADALCKAFETTPGWRLKAQIAVAEEKGGSEG